MLLDLREDRRVVQGPADRSVPGSSRAALGVGHEQCVNTPFGRQCWDTYNYWVNVRFEARLQNCRVVGVDVSSENELYKLPAALADLIGGVVNAARGGTVLAGMPGCD